MRLAISDITKQVIENFEKASITGDDAIHHYAWEMEASEVQTLFALVSSELMAVASAANFRIPRKSGLLLVEINHQNFLVVKIDSHLALFGNRYSAFRASQFAQQLLK